MEETKSTTEILEKMKEKETDETETNSGKAEPNKKITAKKNHLNEVRLRGIVTKKNSNSNYTTFAISCRDYARKRDEKGHYHTDTITVVFFGQEGIRLNKQINLHDHVSVTAVSQSTYDVRTATGRQEVWGIHMAKTKSKIAKYTDDELEGVSYPDDINEFVILGKVTNSYAYGKNWVGITILTNTDPTGKGINYRSQNVISLYTKDAEAAVKNTFTKGTKIIVVGQLESVYKEDTKIKYETKVVTDYKIVGQVQGIVKNKEKTDDSDISDTADISKTETDIPVPKPVSVDYNSESQTTHD